MLRSMTGYGNALVENEKFTINIEVKTLNSKFMDANLRIPKLFSDKEIEIRNLISKVLVRGKVSFSMEYTVVGDNQVTASVNKEVVKKYYQELKEIGTELGADISDIFKIATSLPSAIDTNNESILNDEDWKAVTTAIVKAIDACDQFRRQEGDILGSKLIEYIDTIQSNLIKIDEFDPARIEAVRTKIKEKLEEIIDPEKVDTNRFEQELIYYIEKLDINEEKVRLHKHLTHFREVLNSKEDSGKKLGFISQEIGREINTIGSKAQDANIQRLVVGMKEELEKIKEQTLNIL